MSSIDAEIDFTLLNNLTSLKLEKVDAFIHKVLTGCDEQDLFDTYKDELLVAAVWVPTSQDGTAMTITAVEAVEATKSFKIDFTTPLTAPYNILVKLVAPSVLKTNGLEGFDQPSPLVDKVAA